MAHEAYQGRQNPLYQAGGYDDAIQGRLVAAKAESSGNGLQDSGSQASRFIRGVPLQTSGHDGKVSLFAQVFIFVHALTLARSRACQLKSWNRPIAEIPETKAGYTK